MAETCQLYQYNSSECDYTEGNEALFAEKVKNIWMKIDQAT